MNPLSKGIGRVLTTGVMAAQAMGLGPASADEKVITDQSPKSVATSPKENVGGKLAEDQFKAKEADSDTVKLKDGRSLTKDQYFDIVIKNATNDGILKSPKDFKLKDLQGREIADVQGYERYISSIKERAAQFKDPKYFSRFINTIRTLRDIPGSDKAVLTPRQVEFLIEYPSIHQTSDAVAILFGGIKNGGATVQQAKVKADELIRSLEESKFRDSSVSSR